MSDRTNSSPLSLNPWDEEAIQRDARRLQRVLPRLPEALREELQGLLDEAFTERQDGSVTPEKTLVDRYGLSRRLENAWLDVSGVGHAAENWMTSGYLFYLQAWKAIEPVGGVDVDWLERLASERSAIGEAIECRHVWFFDKAMEQRGEKASPMVREYDPTEVPSYEFVWDE